MVNDGILSHFLPPNKPIIAHVCIMTIRIKTFASLRAQPGINTSAGNSEGMAITHRQGMTVADVWQVVSEQPPPNNLLCSRNLEYVDFNQGVEDGDEIAFFPPVTGG